MHKNFYASGFLYHPNSQQILLQQFDSSSSWSFFGQYGNSNEEPIRIFQQAISQDLSIKLPLKSLYPVYDYFNAEIGKNFFVFYAQVHFQKKRYGEKENSSLQWFTFKQTTKLSFPTQIRQDIVVAERVIKAKQRDEMSALLHAEI